MRTKLIIAIAAVALVWAGPAVAQQTGTLDGTVLDPSGQGLPGVAVTASSPQLLQERTVFTGGNGYFRLPGLSPGVYTLRFELDGFQSVQRTDIRVEVGKVYSIDLQMELRSQEETITVTAQSPIVDTGGSNLGGIYDQNLLQNIPNSRDYYDVMKAMPGVNESDPGSADRRNITVHGSSVRGNVYAVDGVDVSDPVVAYSTTNINYDQIQEIEVQTGGLPAEVGSADGGYVNIVTKSGGNQFSGEGGIFWQGESLQGNNTEGDPEFADFTRSSGLDSSLDASAAIGGPVVRDRVWFFGSARALRNETTVIDVDPLVPIDENQYFIKGTGQLNPDHQVVASFNRHERIEPNFGIGALTAIEATYNRDEAVDTTLLQWNGVFGQDAYAELRFGKSSRFFPLLFQDDATRVMANLLPGGKTTGAAFLQRENDRRRNQLNGALTYFAQDVGDSSHELKFGFEYERSRFTWDVEGGGPGGVNAFYYNLGPDASSPFLVGLSRTPLTTEEAMDKYGLYAQDSMTWGNLTLNVGVRWDLTEGWTPEQSFDGNQWSGLGLEDVGILEPGTFPEKRDEVDWSNVAPRLGAAYDLSGNGRTVVRAFYGRYYNKLIMQFFDFANPNGLGGTLHFWSDPNGDTFVQPGELADAIAVWGGPSGGVSEDLKQPYTDEFNVGVEHELFTDFALGGSFIVKRQRDLIEDVNVGIPDEGYEPVDRVDPATGQTITVFEVTDEFLGQDSFFLLNPEEAFRDYEAVEITARKRMSNNWQLFGSLVWEDSTGNVDTSYGGSTGRSPDFDNPNQRINDTGSLSLQREWQVKMAGTYLAPWGINLSASYRFLSGQRRTRQVEFEDLAQGTVTVNAEPRGSSQVGDQSIVDFRAEKQFEIPDSGVRLGVMLDVFNLTNEDSIISQGFTTGGNFGVIQSIVPPRIMRLGARITF